ncbi:hypothetical protein KESI111651_04300 [Kerstersia similis]
MALGKDAAEHVAQSLLYKLADSGSLKTVGPLITTGSSEETNSRRGQMDAAYVATFYRHLVSELQK